MHSVYGFPHLSSGLLADTGPLDLESLQVEQADRGPVLRCETTDQGVDL
ncbi:hypothetical protein OH805_13235 [Streptomyces sp. NBC_00879]|nr:hypothetical protein OHA61_13640 [Streptomyces sp. NBC_00885]WSY75026.1 hypothetical protein OH805_13235 [Streptomyces sp. NBC_00879]